VKGQPLRYLPYHHNRGETNPNYKGHETTIKNGRYYVRQPDGTFERRYRMVMGEKLGRPLLPTEIVHHKDGDKTNDDPDNLEVHESHRAHLLQHHYWDDEDVITALRAIVTELGHAPTATEYMAKGYRPEKKVIYRLFGSWPNAMKAIGVGAAYRPAHNQFSPRITPEEAIRGLRAAAKKLGKAPSFDTYSAGHYRPSARTVFRLFGSWGKALEAAGLHR
jgi:hypothetical protein